MWGPSAVTDLGLKNTPQEMTAQDIRQVQQSFAEAVLRAKKAGFDGVQMHVAHGYLLSKFLTPYYNRRSDSYGGTIENRARMVLETYQAIRDKVGPDYPVLIKINCDDFMEQGLTFADCKYVCHKLAELGVNAIEVSGGISSSRPGEGTIRTITAEQGSYFRTYAAEIAGEINVPVILVGGNRDFAALMEILKQTTIEYFSFCRPLIRESDLIKRWQSGDLGRSKCVSCTKCFRLDGTRCIFNQK
jgi:2,4-dienoyl-CoA reductase-like NADH-dependent reductase (Old Yellow Enzyme family)